MTTRKTKPRTTRATATTTRLDDAITMITRRATELRDAGIEELTVAGDGLSFTVVFGTLEVVS